MELTEHHPAPAVTSPAAAVGIVHVVGTPSLLAWLPSFGGAGAEFTFAGEDVGTDLLCERFGDRPERTVALHSSHLTLLRDADCARILRSRGGAVIAQSLPAALAGLDKSLTKWLLERADVPVVPTLDGHAPTDGFVVVKRRDGTEAQGSRLSSSVRLHDAGELAEPFIPGLEYSVNVHVSAAGTASFPPVMKGRAREDLSPPVRRVRQCGPGVVEAACDRAMRSMAVRAAAAIGAVGFVEVEFIVDPRDESILVLEVNPRISGTLRMGAMAADIALLDLLRDHADQSIEPVRAAVEAPFSGRSFCDLDAGIAATSRLTVTGDDLQAALDRLRELERDLAGT